MTEQQTETERITYTARGVVVGDKWGGGRCGYRSEKVEATTRDALDAEIMRRIADGSLDSGMGYERVTGAVMVVTERRVRVIDGRAYVAEDSETATYGELVGFEEDDLRDIAWGVGA